MRQKAVLVLDSDPEERHRSVATGTVRNTVAPDQHPQIATAPNSLPIHKGQQEEVNLDVRLRLCPTAFFYGDNRAARPTYR